MFYNIFILYLRHAHFCFDRVLLFFCATDNEIDGSTLLQMTERMSECLFPKVKDQVKFLSAVEKLKE